MSEISVPAQPCQEVDVSAPAHEPSRVSPSTLLCQEVPMPAYSTSQVVGHSSIVVGPSDGREEKKLSESAGCFNSNEDINRNKKGDCSENRSNAEQTLRDIKSSELSAENKEQEDMEASAVLPNGAVQNETSEKRTESLAAGNEKDRQKEVEDELLDPFISRVDFRWPYDYIKIVLMSVFVVPVRIALICVSLAMAYIVASLGLWKVSRERLSEKPLDGWRGKLRWGMAFSGRCMMRSYGFHFLKIKGKLASHAEAPVLVVAPHSSFFDGVAVYWSKVPGLVSRRENLDIPLFGKYIDYTQPVYVWRDNPNSRQSTIQEIVHRATSKDNWPQVMVFPEGTTTNRSCLITFKPGAFYPGVPVQPIVIRYPNRVDTTTWTWDGPGAFKLLWLTLCQVHNYCEIEYLPVYSPNEAEKKDPYLFASNVRDVMAKALGIPTVPYSYDDCRIMNRALKQRLPVAVGLIAYQELRTKYNVPLKEIEEILIQRFGCMARKKCGTASLQEFASKYLRLPATEQSVVELFNLYDRRDRGCISLKDYLHGYYELVRPMATEETVREIYGCFDSNGALGQQLFVDTLQAKLGASPQLATELFKEMDTKGQSVLAYEDFLAFSKLRPEYCWLFLNYKKNVKAGTRQELYSLQQNDKTKTE